MVMLNLTLILITHACHISYSLSYFNLLFGASLERTGLQSMLELFVVSPLVMAACTCSSAFNRLRLVFAGWLLMACRVLLYRYSLRKSKKKSNGIKRWRRWKWKGGWKWKAEGKIANIEEKGGCEDVRICEWRWEGCGRDDGTKKSNMRSEICIICSHFWILTEKETRSWDVALFGLSSKADEPTKMSPRSFAAHCST